MHTVTFETAKRLKEAWFPQLLPQRGQIWFFKSGVGMVVTCGGDLLDTELCDYATASGTLYLSRHLNDGEVFAPTATDILRELPEYAIALHIDYRAEGGEAWFCWDTGDKAKTFTHPTNPAEAAAQAWLHETAKP